jgi:hypothetical protein
MHHQVHEGKATSWCTAGRPTTTKPAREFDIGSYYLPHIVFSGSTVVDKNRKLLAGVARLYQPARP